jgi:hypothetical protein
LDKVERTLTLLMVFSIAGGALKIAGGVLGRSKSVFVDAHDVQVTLVIPHRGTIPLDCLQLIRTV